MRKIHIDLHLADNAATVATNGALEQTKFWKRFLVIAEQESTIGALKQLVSATFMEMYPDEGQIYIYGHLKDAGMADLADRYKICDVLDQNERNLLVFCSRGQVKRSLEEEPSDIKFCPFVEDDSKTKRSKVIVKKKVLKDKADKVIGEMNLNEPLTNITPVIDQQPTESNKKPATSRSKKVKRTVETQNDNISQELFPTESNSTPQLLSFVTENDSKAVTASEQPEQPKQPDQSNPTAQSLAPIKKKKIVKSKVSNIEPASVEKVKTDLEASNENAKLAIMVNEVQEAKQVTNSNHPIENEFISETPIASNTPVMPPEERPIPDSAQICLADSTTEVVNSGAILPAQIAKPVKKTVKKPVANSQPAVETNELSVSTTKVTNPVPQNDNSSNNVSLVEGPVKPAVKRSTIIKRPTINQEGSLTPLSTTVAPYPSVKELSLPKKTAVRKIPNSQSKQPVTIENVKNSQLPSSEPVSLVTTEQSPSNSSNVYSSSLFK